MFSSGRDEGSQAQTSSKKVRQPNRGKHLPVEIREEESVSLLDKASGPFRKQV